ncbi:MAG: ABC transporter ATP-binding protein [Oligoflexus sp.]
MNLLTVRNLKKHFPVHGGIFRRQVATVYAVDDVSFELAPGEVLGLVGESGCGKSTTGRTLMHLYKPSSGEVEFAGMNLLDLDKASLRKLRRDVQMIFQDPYESLNPRHSILQILEEPYIIHEKLSAEERRKAVYALLDRVGLAASYAHRYPHEFSGGQRQRIGIARSIALNPKLIICDEPVSALDVSIQSQVINLLLDLQKELQLAYLFIAHDLAVVKHVSDRIAVMYLGKIVEMAGAQDLYRRPLHPYTQALIDAIPIPEPRQRRKRQLLTGDIPSPMFPPKGCRFHTRCPFAEEQCRMEEPALRKLSDDDNHQVACHFAERFL